MNPPPASLSDHQLLSRFAAEGDQDAFSELVQRYAGLVHGAALRVTGESAAALDAGQHTFILLARKAPLLTGKVSLAGWLHRTAVNAGREAVRSERRRSKREQTAALMDTIHSSAPAATWEEVAPHLDRLLGTLPAEDRDLVLLRYVQGHTFREAGNQLNLSEEAARKRITRALEKLRSGLARAGVLITGAGLSGILTAEAKATVSSETVRTFATASAGIKPSPFWMRLSGRRGAVSAAAAAVLTVAPVCFVISPPSPSPANATSGTFMRIAGGGGAAANGASSAAGEGEMSLREILRRLKSESPPESDEGSRPRTLTDYRREQLVKRLRAADFPGAMAMARGLWSARNFYFLGPCLIKRWAEFQPEAAMNWIRDQRPAWRNGAMLAVRREWEKTDPRAMFQWMAREMAANAAASTIIGQVIPVSQQVYLLSDETIKREPEEFLKMLASAKSAAMRSEAITFAQGAVEGELLKFIGQFPDVAQRELLLRDTIGHVPGAPDIIKPIPAGPFRDGLVLTCGRRWIQSGTGAAGGADWMLGNLPAQHHGLACGVIVDAWLLRGTHRGETDSETNQMVTWLEINAPPHPDNDEVWARVVASGGGSARDLERRIPLAGHVLDPALREWALAAAYAGCLGPRKSAEARAKVVAVLQDSGLDSDVVSRVLAQGRSFPFPQR